MFMLALKIGGGAGGKLYPQHSTESILAYIDSNFTHPPSGTASGGSYNTPVKTNTNLPSWATGKPSAVKSKIVMYSYCQR